MGGTAPGNGLGVRLSDAERDAAAARLGEHGAVGRLTLEELAERVGAAMAAVTDADLAPLFADLPGAGPPAPAPSRWPTPATSSHRRPRRGVPRA